MVVALVVEQLILILDKMVQLTQVAEVEVHLLLLMVD